MGSDIFTAMLLVWALPLGAIVLVGIFVGLIKLEEMAGEKTVSRDDMNA